MKKIVAYFGILFVIANTVLRFFSLGYSNFQGDEVSAQNYLFGEMQFWEFLLSRTVGPMQYILSAAANLLVFGKTAHPEVFVRIPFTLASIAAIYITYRFCKEFFDELTAVMTSLLLACSGLFFAFSRIVQYQSFVILLGISTIYAFSKFLIVSQQSLDFDPNFSTVFKNKNLLVVGFLSGLGFLFHYDALSYILPIILVLLFLQAPLKSKILNLVSLALAFFSTTALFYIPFVLSSSFQSTVKYLVEERIDSVFEFDSVNYSIQLLEIYHSKEFLVMLLLFTFGFLYFLQKKYNSTQKVALVVLLMLVSIRAFSFSQNTYLIWTSTLLALGIGFLHLYTTAKSFGLQIFDLIFTWFLVAFTAYGLFFTMPLTHLYTFLLPLFLLVGYGFSQMNLSPQISMGFLAFLGFTSFSYNYYAFIDANPEYPWNQKSYILGEMSSKISSGGELKGIFGFPYNRSWAEISEIVYSSGATSYRSNEKYRLTKYYIQGVRWDDFNNELYVWIRNPQSLDERPRPTSNIVAENEDYVIIRENTL